MKNSKNEFWWISLLALLSALAALGVYYTSLSNGFVWDDPGILEKQLPAFRSVKDIFFPPYGIHEFGRHYYRPLVISSFIIDKAIWGKSPFGFHLTVFLLHLATTILVFFLARRLFKGFDSKDIGAFVASLLFAVHPIHAESVNWIAGRSDVMAALFFFSSLIFYLKFKDRDNIFWLLLSSLLFLLSCLTKETSITLILLLPVIDLSFFQRRMLLEDAAQYGRKRAESSKEHELRKKGRSTGKIRKGVKKGKGREKSKLNKARTREVSEQKISHAGRKTINVGSYAPFILCASIFLLVRHFALKWAAEKILYTENFFEMLLNYLNSYGFYLVKIFLPINLSAFIPEIPSGLWTSILSIVLFFILMAVLVFSLMKKKGILLFSIIFFIVTLLPSMMLVLFRISETPLADRYLYIPSFSFCLVLGYTLLAVPMWFKGYKSTDSKREESMREESQPQEMSAVASAKVPNLLKITLWLIILAIVVLYSIQTINRSKVWRNDTVFWEDAVKKAPTHGLPHLNLGLAYASEKKWDDAEREYKKALESKSSDKLRSLTFNSLGGLYFHKSDFERAEECFRQAISLRSHDAVPHFNMAVLFWEQSLRAIERGKPPQEELVEKAIQHLDRAIQLNPQYLKAHNLYAEILLRFGYYKKAREHLETVLQYEKEGSLARSARRMLEKIPEVEPK